MNPQSTSTAPLTREVDGFVGRLSGVLGEYWAPSRLKCVVRAPGRLDVMGGFAEYTGALVLSYPIARSTLVAVTPRNDQMIALVSFHHEGNGAANRCSWPLASFYRAPDVLADPGTFAASIDGFNCRGAADVAAALYALLDSKTVADLGGGLTVALRSTLDGVAGVGRSAATSVAVLIALARVLDLSLGPMALANLARTGQNLLWNRAQDVADAASAALAEAGAVLQLHCRSRETMGSLPLPASLAFTGIYCGPRSRDADQKYIDARVTAFMGRNIISRILNADGGRSPAWDGYLSQLTISDYVERLRDRLPTKIKGADFVARFGESGDTITTIDPQRTYKVRSRTEHHIYENARAWQFAERLARCARTNDVHAAVEAGELMYASHWSYGQRCGLGSIPTDRLVTLLRAEGVDAGVYGARISGRGAGGTVVVLHANTDPARRAVARAVEQYAAGTGLQPQVLTGTSPGILAWGVREIS